MHRLGGNAYLNHENLLTYVIPLPKKNPVKSLKKDVRPISLSPCLSKVAEEFILSDYVKPASFKILMRTSMAPYQSRQLRRYGIKSSASETCFVTSIFAPTLRKLIQNRFHLLFKGFFAFEIYCRKHLITDS